MQDNKPLYSQRHPGWGKYNWINKVLDYIYLLFSRPKLTQGNLENARILMGLWVKAAHEIKNKRSIFYKSMIDKNDDPRNQR